ncbi:MAG: biosynthetic-type acetolactate synthase large subunit [Defluviitaleaceae bacterium]|nr:biosynthetic-type acetolactate synthase large subunit [Defluviitaleaceae bacterium]
MQLKGAEILLECLLEQGVKDIFGYPGGQVLPIYDALYKYSDKITHYLASHEQGASHAADGFARATGKVGVCLATSGPGATNLVTGIATAHMDSQPLVAITGNVPIPLLGKDSFQEVDITGITMPITKHNFIVKDVNDLADIMRQAFHIAQSGRPGAVLVDIPKDIQVAEAEYTKTTPKPIEVDTSQLTRNALDEAVKILTESKRPFIYAGGGVVTADARDELVNFAALLDAPVCISAMGKGGFPASHDSFVGMIGMHGTATSNTLVSECDLLIAIGARFSDRVVCNAARFATDAKILHIDIDPAEINKNVLTSHYLIGDVKSALTRLKEALPQQNHKEWINKTAELKAKYKLNYQNDDGLLRPQYIIERINALAGDAVITTEVGQHQMWACQHIKTESPRQFITSGGLGTMGFGLGAAIGAAVATGKTVFNIAGDGCFRMNNIELATAVEYELPVIEVILNNHVLGMVRQWQTLFFDKRYSHTSLDTKTTDFIKLAEAYQAAAFNVTRPEELDDAIKKAMALGKPAVINCEISADDKVFPMVPLGKGVDEYILSES